MEVALNIAWLILSTGLVTLAMVAGKSSRRSPEERVAAAIALACLIAFLFPVISMTDDLNSAALVAENSKGKQWVTIASMVAIVATSFFAAFSAQSRTWADGSILNNLPSLSQEPFSFHMSRRPPPAV